MGVFESLMEYVYSLQITCTICLDETGHYGLFMSFSLRNTSSLRKHWLFPQQGNISSNDSLWVHQSSCYFTTWVAFIGIFEVLFVVNNAVDLVISLWLLEPEPGVIRGTPRRGGTSEFSWMHPVGGPLFDF